VAWFRISFAEKAFLRLLALRGLDLDSLSVDEGVATMLEFYREHRAQHTRLDEEGDGILVQWSDSTLDITRQLIRSGGADATVMQLSLAFTVAATVPVAGNQWFFDPAEPVVVPAFFTGPATAVTLRYEAA
jgi:hypothetical protein